MEKRKTYRIAGYSVTYSHRTKDEPMGRFGGGWQWKFGIQWGSTSCVLSLLVCEIIIRKYREPSLF